MFLNIGVIKCKHNSQTLLYYQYLKLRRSGQSESFRGPIQNKFSKMFLTTTYIFSSLDQLRLLFKENKFVKVTYD